MSKVKPWLSLSAAIVVLASADTPAQSVAYTFIELANTYGPIARFDPPVISNTGTVSFSASLRDGRRGVFALRETDLILIGDTTQFPDFNSPSISGNGTILICVREANSGPGVRILAWRGEDEFIEVLNRDDGPFSDLSTLPALNDSDYVAFWGRLVAGGDVIGTKRIGDPTFEVVSTGVTGPDQAPALNSARTIAFAGAPAGIGGNAIFRVDRKGSTVVASDVGTFHAFSGAVSLNDAGELAFHTVLDSGVAGVYVADKRGVRAFALSTDDLRSPARPVMNNRGEVAFIAALSNGANAILVGPDPVRHRVMAVGDMIDGVAVDALDFFRGLNDRGQIVFAAAMRDGSQRLYRADPHR
jgi:hypothetical protein